MKGPNDVHRTRLRPARQSPRLPKGVPVQVALAHLDDLVGTGWPVVVGTSRKSTLGRLLAQSDGTEELPPVEDRLEASLATATWAMALGAGMIRAHDVRATAVAALVVHGDDTR